MCVLSPPRTDARSVSAEEEPPVTSSQPYRHSTEACDPEAFAALITTPTDPADYPRASRIDQGVVIYEAAAFETDGAEREALMAEVADALADGPGVIVIEGAIADRALLDQVTEDFRAIIAQEQATGTARGDHFAKAGANDRVWNALEKLAVHDPDAFVAYYGNDVIALVCEAWLGPGYQVTSQVNQVNPGGAAQSPHRDYHLGFQGLETITRFPARAHAMSATLTLQGAVAHVDMPVETGPTLLLPHSQKYAPGYVAWQLPAFKDLFAQHVVQLPLRAGDALFFSPALHHAAGENRTADVRRLGNLLQVSSAMGRAMEAVDRERMSNALYPALLRAKRAGMPARTLANAIAASAEGYAFPTDLDRDQPSGSAAPATQADLVREALEGEWSAEALQSALADQASLKRGTR